MQRACIYNLPMRRNFLHRVLVLISAFFALCVTDARAAEPLQMRVDSPFALGAKPLSIQTKTGRWFPVAVTLRNDGEPVSGRLELRLSSSANSSNRSASFFSDVDLPTTGRKLVWLYGRAEGSELDRATVTFAGRGFKTMRQPIELKPIETYQRIVLTLSDSGERLGFLRGLKDRKLGDADALRQIEQVENYPGQKAAVVSRQFLQPVGSTRNLIPDRAIGLEAADILFARDFAQSALRPEQLAALRGYVTLGGTLVVAGGADWQRLSTSPLRELWPLEAKTSSTASPQETAALVRRYVGEENLSGGDRLGGAPVILLRGTPKPEATRIGVQSGNFITARDWGAGRVLELAFDPSSPPFIGWDGQGALWSDLVQNRATATRLESVNDDGFNADPNIYNPNQQQRQLQGAGALLSVIRRLPQLQTPPTSVIAWFLALYVFCLVPLNYFILRGIDKRELAWVTIPVIAILFSVVSYMAARRIKGTDLLARHINIVQGSGLSGEARADSMLWIYSPRKTSYTIASSDARMTFGDYLPGGFEPPASSLQLRQPDASRAFRVEDAPVKMWDEAQFVGQSTVSVGRGIELLGARANLRVHNRTGFSLQGAVLVGGSGVWKCGDIRDGATAKAQLKGTGGGTDDMIARIAAASDLAKLFPSQRIKRASGEGFADSTLRDLAQATLRAAWKPNASRVENVLIAWGTQPMSSLAVEGETPRQQNVTLFIFRVPSSQPL